MNVARIRRLTRNIACDTASYLGFVPIQFETDFIISASNGLYILKRGKIRRLLKGNMFGLTQLEDNKYLAFRYVQNGTKDERSFSLTFELDGYKAKNVQSFRFFDDAGNTKVPVRVHQVRKHGDYLFITNTRQNTLWKATTKGEILSEWVYSEKFDYDKGSSDTNTIRKKARNSENYHHFNSLHITPQKIFILAHNSAGIDKSKKSFLLELDHQFNVVNKTKNIGIACHDLIPVDDSFYYCDSANGKVSHPNYPSIDVGMFTRGAELFNQHLLVAGTVMKRDVNERGQGHSRLFVIPISGDSPVCSIQLGRLGDIHDINAVKG